MSGSEELEELVRRIEAAIAPHRFKRLEQSCQGLPGVVAAWKRKGLMANRGVALLGCDPDSGHPGDLARSMRKPVGKLLGYIPFLYELGLHLIVGGRGILAPAEELLERVDKINTQTVILQSLHVVDLSAGERLAELPLVEGLAEKEEKVAAQKIAQALRYVPVAGRPARWLPQDPMKTRLDYSRQSGRAVSSARSWGLHYTGSVVEAIETGLSAYVHSRP